MAVIHLKGGKFDGALHEVAGGFNIPDRIALIDESNNNRLWYKVSADKKSATYEITELAQPKYICTKCWEGATGELGYCGAYVLIVTCPKDGSRADWKPVK